ncbi:hypothetical protein DL96DRAFT_1589435 [Flagelloscypha sp. PMI_526]|nr:hypothetical protein DL96DRAFT_1589435 [Flagelloscypha sp. PMI_526]
MFSPAFFFTLVLALHCVNAQPIPREGNTQLAEPGVPSVWPPTGAPPVFPPIGLPIKPPVTPGVPSVRPRIPQVQPFIPPPPGGNLDNFPVNPNLGSNPSVQGGGPQPFIPPPPPPGGNSGNSPVNPNIGGSISQA